MKKIFMILFLGISQLSGYSGYTHWYINSTPYKIKVSLAYMASGSAWDIKWCNRDEFNLEPNQRVFRRPHVCSINRVRGDVYNADGSYRQQAEWEASLGFAGSAIFHFEEKNGKVVVNRKAMQKIP